MVELVKAVMPAREHAWLVNGLESVAGFVVRADDIAWATTPSQLVEALGLDFPGSPVDAAAPFVDLLKFESNGMLSLINATGGPTQELAERTGGPFVEPAPFTGTGFVAVADHLVPLWWLEPTRIPAGAQLWRVQADGQSTLLAVYPHVGIGWQVVPGLDIGAVRRPMPSSLLGVFGTYQAERVFSDVLPDGSVIAASPAQLAGLENDGGRGLRWSVVEGVTPTALRVRAQWRGMPFHVIERSQSADGDVAGLLYAGRNYLVAEAAGLAKTDQGVYEAAVPWSELSDIEGVEITAGAA